MDAGPSSRHPLAVAGLLLAHAVLAIGATLQMSATYDEVAHLTAGYSYWHVGDYRLIPDHPPVAQLWAAAPLVVLQPTFPSLEQETWWHSDPWLFGRAFVYEMGNDAEQLLLCGRAMIVLLSVALGLTVYLWSRRLLGPWGGLVSLTLYALSPTMLAHGALITTDLSVGLFFLWSVWGLWSVLHRVTLARVLVSALAVAGLVLSKMSGLLIVPMAAGLVLVRLTRREGLTVDLFGTRTIRSRAGQLGVFALSAGVHVLVVWGCVWAMYGFHFEAFRSAVPGRDRLSTFGPAAPHESSWDHELSGLGAWEEPIRWARDHRVLPESFLYGLAFVHDSTRTRATFLNGARSLTGFWWYFPYAFLVKTPLPLFGVAILAVAAWAMRPGFTGVMGRRSSRLGSFYRTAPLWMLMVVYGWSAVTSHINIGHRHLLPIYPALFILCGAAAGLGKQWRCLRSWCPAALLALYAVAALSAWPHPLAYFNTLAGGAANGYRHLVDSSVDWGQDLKRLAGWSAGPTQDGGAVYLSYAGNALPQYYGIDARMLPSHAPWDEQTVFPLAPGTYCISATMLQQVYLLPSSRWTVALERAYQTCLPRIRRMQGQADPDEASEESGACRLADEMLAKLRFGRLCAALRSREPDARVGYSILIYELAQQRIADALFGEPAELCADTADGLCELALQMGAAGDLQQATTLLEEAVELAPSNPSIRRWLALGLHDQGRWREALEQYSETLRIDPKFSGIHVNIGSILAQTGRPAEAIRMYRAALDLNPRDVWAQAGLAMALGAVGQADEAVARARAAIRLRPRDPTHRFNLADLLARLGRLEEAVAESNTLLVSYPDMIDGYLLLAAVYGHQGRLDEAIAVAQNGLQRAEAAGDRAAVEHLRERIETLKSAARREEP